MKGPVPAMRRDGKAQRTRILHLVLKNLEKRKGAICMLLSFRLRTLPTGNVREQGMTFSSAARSSERVRHGKRLLCIYARQRQIAFAGQRERILKQSVHFHSFCIGA